MAANRIQVATVFDEEVIAGDPGRFDNIEIHGVRYLDDVDVEQDDENPDFFSTYLHLKEGGVACVGDFPSLKEAEAHALLLSQRHGWPCPESAERAGAGLRPRGR